MSGPVDDLTRAVEAALFAATEPMSAEALSKHLGGAQVRGALALLAAHYAGRGVQLVERGRRGCLIRWRRRWKRRWAIRQTA